jgi:pilus assembly protein Flp/PilA
VAGFAGTVQSGQEQVSRFAPGHQSLTIQDIGKPEGRAGTAFANRWQRNVCCLGKAVSIMMSIVKKFLADESGATAIEYGLIAAGISLAIISTVNGLGTRLNSRFASISSSLH